jgi:ketosteroid isomerase-like protein
MGAAKRRRTACVRRATLCDDAETVDVHDRCGCGDPTPPAEVRTMTKTKPTDEKAIIAKVIRDNIMWALTKDVEMQKDTMAHDEDLFIIWTGSTHITSGWKEHEKSFETWLDPRFKAVRTEVRDLQIHLSRSGDVAWFFANLDDVVSWDGKVSRFGEGLRWTGVLEKRDGRWVIVQLHASLAVDKVREIVLKEVQPAA